MNDDHYGTVGVDKNADEDEIRQAYRSKAQQEHPDKGGDVAKFQALQHAYDVLADPDKRRRYDAGEDVGKRVVTIEEKATNVLVRSFTQCLDAAKDSVDLIVTVRTVIDIRVNELGTQKRKADTHIAQMHHLQARVTHNGGGTDLFHSLTEQRIEAATEALVKMDEEDKVLGRALQLLGEYECEVRQSPVPGTGTARTAYSEDFKWV